MSKIQKYLQYEHPIFGLILISLHSLIWTIPKGYIHFSVCIVLLGLLLLWQPIWNKNKHFALIKILVPSLLFLVSVFYFTYETLILLSLVVIGILGSRIFDKNHSRPFGLLAISIVTLEACIGIVPLAFPQIKLPPLFADIIQAILLICLLAFFFSNKKSIASPDHRNIDMLHGTLTASLISLVLLGGIVINLLYGVDYLDGILLTVFIVTTMTLGISWFWNPAVGFSGLGVLWNRYSMSIGSPFEQWINTLTTLIEEEYLTPNEYLQSACDNLTNNEWLNGINWPTNRQSIISGHLDGHIEEYDITDSLTVTIYFKSHPGDALMQHTQLLIRMANQFYIAKKNQEKVKTQEHFETIHHTGARLTHDIKNILQSIKTSISIIQLEPNHEANKPFSLLEQNLTQISSRLENTLSKLKMPQLNTRLNFVQLNDWLDAFKKEHSRDIFDFQTDIKNNLDVPTELLDSVLNNLISNAQAKNDVTSIQIKVISDKQMFLISVCDNGAAMDEDKTDMLFIKPMSSGQGMGIGLYQSAIMAQAFHFDLSLLINENGRVCFSLIRELSD